VYAQRYSPDGAVRDATFLVNTYTTGIQRFPGIAADADGDLVVVWQSEGQDGSGYGIYAQRFDESADAADPMPSGTFVDGERAQPYSTHAPPLRELVVGFSEQMSTSGGSTGATSVTNAANWLLTRNGIDVTATVGSITFGHSALTNRYEATLNLSSTYNSGSFLLMARDVLRDVAGNRLDGNRDGVPGGALLLPFGITSLARGPEFLVNTYTPSTQDFPAVATDVDGDFVVAWHSYAQDGDRYGIYAQRYTAAGVRRGGEFRVNTHTTGYQLNPAVAMDADGDFVIVWESGGQEGPNNYGVFARRYNAAGVAQGGELHVNTYTTETQGSASVAMDDAGNFVVAWRSWLQDGSINGAYAQRFNAAGVPQGGEFRVNTQTTENQSIPVVAMDADGDFVIAWDSSYQDGSGRGIYAQRYDAAGAPVGGEFHVNTFTTGYQATPRSPWTRPETSS
jgi:hypothetical protein